MSNYVPRATLVSFFCLALAAACSPSDDTKSDRDGSGGSGGTIDVDGGDGGSGGDDAGEDATTDGSDEDAGDASDTDADTGDGGGGKKTCDPPDGDACASCITENCCTELEACWDIDVCNAAFDVMNACMEANRLDSCTSDFVANGGPKAADALSCANSMCAASCGLSG